MTKYERIVLTCLRTAREDRTFWTPLQDSRERQAARGMVEQGLLVIAADEQDKKCIWVAPTRKGLALVKEG